MQILIPLGNCSAEKREGNVLHRRSFRFWNSPFATLFYFLYDWLLEVTWPAGTSCACQGHLAEPTTLRSSACSGKTINPFLLPSALAICKCASSKAPVTMPICKFTAQGEMMKEQLSQANCSVMFWLAGKGKGEQVNTLFAVLSKVCLFPLLSLPGTTMERSSVYPCTQMES